MDKLPITELYLWDASPVTTLIQYKSSANQFRRAFHNSDQTSHLISCSISSKSSQSKNSLKLISKPSQIFLIETTPGFCLFSFSMLYTVEGDTPAIVARPFTAISLSWQSWRMRLATASLVFNCILLSRYANLTTTKLPFFLDMLSVLSSLASALPETYKSLSNDLDVWNGKVHASLHIQCNS